MNGYKCFYRGQVIEVKAKTSYEAQQKAMKIFKTKKSYYIAVMLCEKNGKQVEHTPDF